MAHLDTERISAFIDQELSPADMAQVEDHLRSCEECHLEYRQLLGIATLVRELPVYSPHQAIVIDAQDHNRDAGIWPTVLEFAKPIALAAAVILVALTGLRFAMEFRDDADTGDEPISDVAQFEEQAGTESDSETSESLPAPDADAPQMAEAPPEDAAPPLAAVSRSDDTVSDADEVGGTGDAADPKAPTDDAVGFGQIEAIVAGIVVVSVAGAAVWRVRNRGPSNSSRA